MRKFLLLALLTVTFNLYADNIEITICDVVSGEQTLFELDISESIVAGDDNCASAVVLSDGVLDSGDNTGFGEEAGEPIPTGLTSPIASEWYSYTMPAGEDMMTITFTENTMTDGVVSVYSGDCSVDFSGLTSLYENTGGGTVCLAAGTTYLIQVATDGSGTEGMYDITVSSAPGAPTNDDCLGAITVTSGDSGNNFCASDHLVWYSYTYDGTGNLEDLDITVAGDATNGQSLDAVMVTQVRVNDCANPDVYSSTSPNVSCLQPGDVVYIEVGDNVTPAHGEFTFTFTELDNGIANETCGEASVLTDLTCSNSLTGTGNAAACPDTEATCTGFDYTNNPTAGVWYTFDVNGQVDLFDITGSSFEVFTGPDCTTLTQLGCEGDAALTGISDDPTTTYYILVFDGGDFTVQANPSLPSNDDCASAIALTDATAEAGTTSCATPHDAAFCTLNTTDDHVVYYTYEYDNTNTKSTDLTFSVTTPGGTNDAGDILIELYEDCANTPYMYSVTSGDLCDVLAGNVTIECVAPGTTITIALGSTDGMEGDFEITVTSDDTSIPSNDLCLDPVVITLDGDCDWTDAMTNNSGACVESGDGNCDFDAEATVWMQVVMSANAIGFEFQGLDGNTSIGFFVDTDCTEANDYLGAQIGPCVQTDGDEVLVGDGLVAGSTYNLAVSSTVEGDINFEILAIVPPANDDCVNAIALTDATLQDGTTGCATPHDVGFCSLNTTDDHVVYYTYEYDNTNTKSTDLTFSFTDNTNTIGTAATGLQVELYEDCANTAYDYTVTSGDLCDALTGDIIIECVAPGTTITIAVGSPEGSEGDFDITVTSNNSSIPDNDLCLDPVVITLDGDCDWTDVMTNNADACVESGDGNCNFDAEATVWMQVVLPANAVGFEFQGLDGNTSIGLFSDADCTEANDYLGTQIGNCVQADGDQVLQADGLTPGNTYNLAVSSTVEGDINFEILAIVPPANDICNPDAEVIPGSPNTPTSVEGTTLCATSDANFTCAGGATDHVVYYEYTTDNVYSDVTISAITSTATTGTAAVSLGVNVWADCTGAGFTPPLSDNEECDVLNNDLEIECVPPNTILVIAVGNIDSEEGDFQLTIDEVNNDKPANDGCTSPDLTYAALVECEWTQITDGDNTNACPESNNSSGANCNFDIESTVWYSFDVPAGTTELEFENISTNYTLGLFNNDCGPNGELPSPVGDCVISDGTIDLGGALGVTTTFLVAVSSDAAVEGAFTFNIKPLVPPAGDDPCDAIVGAAGSNIGTTICANHDYDFLGCGDADNNLSQVWVEYTFGPGEVALEITLTATDAATGPYDVGYATDCNALGDVDVNDFVCDLANETEPYVIKCEDEGTTVYIMVGTEPDSEGEFDLNLNVITNTCTDNDDCADASTALDDAGGGEIVTDADPVCVDDCNEYACEENLGSCGLVDNVVWYQVTNDGMGEFINIEITDADFATPIVAVFDACGGTQIGPCTIGESNGALTGPIEIDPINDPEVESYWIAVGTDPDEVGGDFTICVEITSGCVNDDPCDAVAMEDGVTLDSPTSTTGCSDEFDNDDCVVDSENTVWYKYEIPPGVVGFTITINNLSITGDISLQIGEFVGGDCNAIGVPQVMTCSGDAVIEETLECAFEGQEYYIQVASSEANAGDFDITLDNVTPDQTSAPDNDACGSAEAFTVPPYCEWIEITGTTVKACPEQFIAGGCDYSVTPAVWYEIAIPDDPNIVEMSVQVEGIDLDEPMFSILDDACGEPAWTAISGNALCVSGGNEPELLDEDITAWQGETLKIVVGSNTGDEGEFTIRIKVDRAPDNDNCETAEEIAVGGSTMGTTRCATKSDINFDVCDPDLNLADVFYTIPIDPSFDAIKVTVSGFTGDGPFGTQLFLFDGDCPGVQPAENPDGSPMVECGTGDKEFILGTKCLDPSITHIVVKVGSEADDGDDGNGEEEGDFNIMIEGLTPSCDYADECADITGAQQLEPVTNPNFELDYVCLQSCLDFACPQDPPSPGAPCDTDQWPTVWFEISTDDEAAQIFATVEPNGTWEASWTLYGGDDCDNLEQLSTAATPPCNNDDTTPDLLQQPVLDEFDTYWIAVTVEPNSLPVDQTIDDPGFELCVATTINAIVCLGDLESSDCAEPSLEFEVTSVTDADGNMVEIDPDGDLMAGPFCQGMEVCMTVEFFYDASETGVDWIIGFVPSFGPGWDMEGFDFDGNAPEGNGMTAQWYEEGGDCNWEVQEPVPILCTYTDDNGNLQICNLLCESCPCASSTLQPGDQLPSGYAWVTNGGNAGCENDCSPGEGWGIGTTTVNITWEMCLIVKEFDSQEECFENNDLQISFQTFSDGVGGCWEDPVGECLLDKKQLSPPWMIDCNAPPHVVATPNPEIICNNGTTDIFVETDPFSTYLVEIWFDDNPNIIGENNYTFPNGTGIIADMLENISGAEECVTYYGQVQADDVFTCPGPITEIIVCVQPELIVDIPDAYVCDGFCNNITANPSGGTGVGYMYEWSTGETTPTIEVCPTVPTTYFVTVTDNIGCSGIGEVEVDVKPNVEFFFEPDPVLVCKNGIYDPQDPTYTVVTNITNGSAPFQVVWDSPFGLFGDEDDIAFHIDHETSVPGVYNLCATVIDVFDCEATECVEVSVFDAPQTFLENDPVACGDETVDLLGTFVSLNGAALEVMNLYDCDGNFIVDGYGNPTVFEDVDLNLYDCFYLEVIDVNGCVGESVELQITPPLGTPVMLDGDTERCSNDPTNSSISVTNDGDYTLIEWSTSQTGPSILVSPDVTTTYGVTVTEANGCTDTEVWELVVNDPPVFDINGSLSFCEGSSTTLETTSNPDWTYSWVHSVDGEISTTNSCTVSTAGTVTLTVTNAEDCSDSEAVNITVDTNLDIQLNDVALCDMNPDSLRAGDGFAMYEWEGPSGALPDTDSKIEVSEVGTYSVTVTDATGCSGVGTAEVTNSSTPSAMVTDTVIVCRVDNGIPPGVILDFTAQVTGDAGTWTAPPTSGVDLTDLTNVSFEGEARDTYDFVYTTNIATAPCEDVSDTMSVIVINCPCPNVGVTAIPDQCNDNVNPVNLNNYLNANNDNDGSWSEVAGNPQTGTVTNDEFLADGIAAGTYQVQWTIDTPVGDCPTADTTEIVVYQAPIAGVTDNSINLCNEDNNLGDFEIDLNTLLTTDTDPGSWMQTAGVTAGGTLPVVNTLSMNIGEVMEFTYMTNNATDPCEEATTIVVVTVIDCNCPQIELATDTLCNGDMTLFDLTALITSNTTNQTGTWSSPSGGPNQQLPVGSITGSNLNPSGIPSGLYDLLFTFDNDPGGNCIDEWPTTILIRRQPQAVAEPDGHVCNTSASGVGSTSINLFSLLELGYSSGGSWSQSGGVTVTIEPDATVDFEGATIGDVYTFTYSVDANQPCSPIAVDVNVIIDDCNCLYAGVMPPDTMCNEAGGLLDLNSLLEAGSDPGDWSVTYAALPQGLEPGDMFDTEGREPGDYEICYTFNPTPPSALCPQDTCVELHLVEQKIGMLRRDADIVCNNTLDGNNNTFNFNDVVDFTDPFDANGTWTQTGGPVTIDLSNPGLVTFDEADGINLGDVFTFEYTVMSDSPCEDRSYPFTLTIDCSNCDPLPVINVPDLCSTEGVIDLTDYETDRPGGTWTSTEVTITGNTVDITGLDAGMYTVTYEVPDPQPAPCINEVPVTLTVFNPANSGVGSAIELCPMDTLINLADLLTDQDPGGTWVDVSTSPAGIFDAVAGTFQTTGIDANGEFKFEYQFTNQDPCPDQATEVTVIVNNIPTVDAGNAQSITCAVNQVTLTGIVTGDNLVYEWTHESGNPVDGGDQLSITVNYGGEFTLTVTNSVTGCSDVDQVIVDVDPSIPQAEVNHTDPPCPDDTGSISITNVTGGDGNFMFSIDGGQTFGNETIFEDLPPGEYNVVIQDGQGCNIEEDVVIDAPQQLVVELGPSQIIELGTQTTLDISTYINGIPDLNVVWTAQPEDGSSAPVVICESPEDCSSVTIMPDVNTIYTVTLTDANNCTVMDQVLISLRKVVDISIPNIISPDNDDPDNDYFYVSSPDIQGILSLQIFDRWGTLVYSRENLPGQMSPTDGWNGTLNGKDVEQGVYAYLIKYVILDENLNLVEEKVAGDVTVVR